MSALVARRPVRGTISSRAPRDLDVVDPRPAGTTEQDAETVRTLVHGRCDDADVVLAALGLSVAS